MTSRVELRNFKIYQIKSASFLYKQASIACIAMCLDYLGALIHDPNPFVCVERFVIEYGLSFDMRETWLFIINVLGQRVKTRPIEGHYQTVTMRTIQEHLDKGFPAILLGDVPIVVIGYTPTHLIVVNPCHHKGEPLEISNGTAYRYAHSLESDGMRCVLIERHCLDSRLVGDIKHRIMNNELDYDRKTDSLVEVSHE